MQNKKAAKRLNAESVKSELKELVRNSVEETLNELTTNVFAKYNKRM